MSIFDRRVAFKPYDYPEVLAFVDAINHSYWVHTEWNFIADVQDFHVVLSPMQQDVIRKTLLAISQIEVSVKTFWGRLEQRFPRPEFNAVGVTFAESEVRHERAYSTLLETLGFNDAFDNLLDVPAIQGRVQYLTHYMNGVYSKSDKHFTLSLALFTLFIENVSLFTQFAIVKSFNKHLNVLKDVDNVIQATMKEEQVHALLGTYLINQIREEFPEWFDSEFIWVIQQGARRALEAEIKILDWIFEDGELDFVPKAALVEFLKQRFNESLEGIGLPGIFEVDQAQYQTLFWLVEEIHGQTHVDFFYKRSTNYSKNTLSVTANDLF